MKKRILLFMSVLLTAIGAWSQASIIVEPLPYNAIGQKTTLVMSLSNEKAVKSFQADVALPDFITFDNVAPQVTTRTTDFEIAYRRMSEHKVRIVVSSGVNAKLTADSAAVVKFNVTLDNTEELANQTIAVTQAAAILENYRKVDMPDTAFQTLAAKPTFVIRYEIDGTEFCRDTLMVGEIVVPLDTVPTKEGHTFSGWLDLPETMPAQDVTVTGSFSVNRYRLVYMLDGEEYSVDSIAYGTALVQKEALTKEGHTFSGWLDLPETMPAQDVTVTGSFSVNRYRLVYMLDGEEYSVDSIAYGTALVQKEALTKEGHTFSGWSELPETMPAQDVTVTGSFTVNRYLVTYMLEGETFQTDSVAYGTAIPTPEVPARPGYNFSGWKEVPATMPAQDVTLYGNYTINKDNKYNVIYMVDGVEYKREVFAFGDTIVVEAEPAKEGYTFSGWSEVPEIMPLHDVTVTGAFTVNQYRLVYMLDGEEYSVDSIAYGTTLVQKEALTKEGYTFSGWSELPETMPAQDVTVTGAFTVNRYLLTFVLDGDTLRSDSVEYGASFSVPQTTEREGYTFCGWGEVVATMPAQDLTYTAAYILNANQTDAQGLVYRLNDVREAFTVVGYTDELVADVVVPETLYGLPVDGIQDKALLDAAALESIAIPASVTSVGTAAFGGCHNLLVVEWNATAPLRAECFDQAEAYGNMLVFTATEGDFAGNVVVDGVAEEIVLTDGLPFRNPKNFTAGRISYSREFMKETRIGGAEGWEAIVLPFDVQTIVSKEKGELRPFGLADFNTSLPCWIAGMNDGEEFEAIKEITANMPFIMKVPNSEEYAEKFNIEGTVTFMAEQATVSATETEAPKTEAGFRFRGTYRGVAATPYVYALNDEGYTADDGRNFMPGGAFVSDLRDVRPFEAYVNHTQLTSLRYLSIGGGEADGIGQILLKHNANDDAWYTIQGIRLNGKPQQKGVYIHNGKAVVVK